MASLLQFCQVSSSPWLHHQLHLTGRASTHCHSFPVPGEMPHPYFRHPQQPLIHGLMDHNKRRGWRHLDHATLLVTGQELKCLQ